MKVLQLRFENGDTATIAFGVDSTLTVETPDGVNGVKRGSWSEITDVEITDAPDPVEDTPGVPVEETVPADDPTLVSPEAALVHASTLAATDAAVHVDAALVKWPEDSDLLAAKAELAEILAA